MLRRVLVCVTVMAAVAAIPAVSSAATGASKSPSRKPGPAPRYYVALGDSLSQGMQPNAQGQTVNTDDGYVDDIGAWATQRIPSLRVIKLGCGGDTTTSLLTGKGNSANAKALRCDRRGGSQLKAAVSFLKSHHAAGEVPLITIDIGANDVDRCHRPEPERLPGCRVADDQGQHAEDPQRVAQGGAEGDEARRHEPV